MNASGGTRYYSGRQSDRGTWEEIASGKEGCWSDNASVDHLSAVRLDNLCGVMKAGDEVYVNHYLV